MITVRPYQKQDFRFVQDICALSARESSYTERVVSCALACDYYLDNEPQHCFVAEVDGKIVGYVLCAAEFGNFSELMTGEYLPLVRKLSGSQYFRGAAEMKMAQRYAKQGYTARIQLVVLPRVVLEKEWQETLSEYHRVQLASNLLDALSEVLAQPIMEQSTGYDDETMELFVEGVYTICSEKDEDERAFWESKGYQDIDYASGSVVYAKKLVEDDE